MIELKTESACSKTLLSPVRVFNGDCLEIMKSIPNESVDLILTDPPYNTTDCKWDKQPINWELLKIELLRIIKPSGTICISVQNPFGFLIGGLFAEIYRHKWVWEKDRGANFQCLKAQPLRITEDILVTIPISSIPTTRRVIGYCFPVAFPAQRAFTMR